MAGKEVRVLGFYVSPFSFRVEWALKLKAVEYEYIEEDIFNKSPLLLQSNPIHKKVPVLIHDSKIIAESFIILEYIDETWKQHPLLPQDPYGRAMSRFWAKFAEEKLLPAAFVPLCTYEGEEREKNVKSVVEALGKLEGELKGKKFFGGESIGYLDLMVGWVSYWLPVWEEIGRITILDPLKFPAVTAWINNFLNHPVIKANLPPRDKMIAYFEKRSKEIASLRASSTKG